MEEAEGRVLYALKSYQIIETTLKAYLCRLSESEAGESRSKFTKSKVKNKPLGWLLREFKLHNKNVGLQQMLDEIKSERDEVAHQALVSQKPGIAEILGVDTMQIQRLREIDRNASRAMTAMVCEFIKSQPKQCAENVV
ncbi:hypothetical protein [Azonexus sp. IMCC34839]|uniref:hypothetical protein n=1 Tax=Azonexus sp. IMCC34839 TaxID=3133695 RepID=UPI00399B573A